MGQPKFEDAQRLAQIRREIVIHCEGLPDLIKIHGRNAIGHVALGVGKCFLFIGPVLDQYHWTQPLPGIAPLPGVAAIGERFRVIGLEMLHCPSEGDLQRTIDALKKQVAVLTRIAANGMEAGR